MSDKPAEPTWREGMDWKGDPVCDYPMHRRLHWLLGELCQENLFSSFTKDVTESANGRDILAMGTPIKTAKEIIKAANQHGWRREYFQLLQILWDATPEVPEGDAGRFGRIVYHYQKFAYDKGWL